MWESVLSRLLMSPTAVDSHSTDRFGVEFNNRCPLFPFQVISMNSYLPMEEKERSYPEEPNI